LPGTIDAVTDSDIRQPPGTEQPRRLRPKLRYELVGCGLHGHELLGTDVANIRPEDSLVAREDADGLRWYRCLRCDSWLPLQPPEQPARHYLPNRSVIELPLRGKPLRDKYVLRAIAVDRFVHFLVLAVLAVALLLFVHDRAVLDQYWVRILRGIQAGVGGPAHDTSATSAGLFGEVNKLFTADSTHLLLAGLALAAYALLEGTEAVGLWLMRRWAEYLTFIATSVLLLPELYELSHQLSVLKIVTLVINLVVVIYLLFAKRLFGLRGGGEAEQREREVDSGWGALERTLPTGRRTQDLAGQQP
jgi:uncharacterized membrane protein (DUF2068 family)